MYINALNPTVTMNPSRIMNLLKGFELDAIFSEFNSVFRVSLKRKLKSNFGFVLVCIGICICMHVVPGFESTMKPD